MEKVPEVSVHEAQERIQAGALLLDVREQNEFDEVHIGGSTFLPLSEFMGRYEAELPKDREVVVHCRSGKRSAQVTEFLIERGYDAVNVAGGLLAWEEAELSVER